MNYDIDFVNSDAYKKDIEIAENITHIKTVFSNAEYFILIGRKIQPRLYEEKTGDVFDVIHILDRQEAIEHRWIWPNGVRHWVLPPDNEWCYKTFLFGFNTMEEACAVYDSLSYAEVGVNARTL